MECRLPYWPPNSRLDSPNRVQPEYLRRRGRIKTLTCKSRFAGMSMGPDGGGMVMAPSDSRLGGSAVGILLLRFPPSPVPASRSNIAVSTSSVHSPLIHPPWIHAATTSESSVYTSVPHRYARAVISSRATLERCTSGTLTVRIQFSLSFIISHGSGLGFDENPLCVGVFGRSRPGFS